MTFVSEHSSRQGPELEKVFRIFAAALTDKTKSEVISAFTATEHAEKKHLSELSNKAVELRQRVADSLGVIISDLNPNRLGRSTSDQVRDSIQEDIRSIVNKFARAITPYPESPHATVVLHQALLNEDGLYSAFTELSDQFHLDHTIHAVSQADGYKQYLDKKRQIILECVAEAIRHNSGDLFVAFQDQVSKQRELSYAAKGQKDSLLCRAARPDDDNQLPPAHSERAETLANAMNMVSRKFPDHMPAASFPERGDLNFRMIDLINLYNKVTGEAHPISMSTYHELGPSGKMIAHLTTSDNWKKIRNHPEWGSEFEIVHHLFHRFFGVREK